MQDITKEKCDSIPAGTEGRLIDKRDNKVYWVGKIKNKGDDNALCWMTQNLDYDGGAVAGYSGSDVVALEKGTSFTSSTQSQKLYYDPGEYVSMNLTNIINCYSATTSTGLGACPNSSWKLRTKTSNADVYELVDVSNWIPTNDLYFVDSAQYVGIDSLSICSKDVGSMLGDDEFSQCKIYYGQYANAYEHYLAGNYYNWMGATNGATAETGDIDTSICPAGWSLPLGGNASTTSTGSYSKLFGSANYATITTKPYYFVSSGNISSDSLSAPGTVGNYWSSTAYSSTRVLALSFQRATNANSSSYSDRHLGFSVRCVAR